ncbi:MAG: 30S ribosome-binding factor RbfA [Candidatus Yanofskybacteria bacterium]|nr:30S ribosome-binding factor RbfA [Candidatus Yanofskybacteria bacterium]
MSERIKKLNDLLRDEVAKILLAGLEKDDSILVTVTGADVSSTLEHATIKISVYPDSKARQILKKINQKIYNVQQLLNKRLAMRPIPKIRFEIDQREEQASKINELFKKHGHVAK